jgi:hypothetical protein
MTPIVITTYTPTSVAGFSLSRSGSAQPTSSSTAPPGSWDVVSTIDGPLPGSSQVSTVPSRAAAVALLVDRLGAELIP